MEKNNKKSTILNVWIVEIKSGAEMQLGKRRRGAVVFNIKITRLCFL